MQKAFKLNFLNSAAATFALEEVQGLHQVRGFIYSKAMPTPLYNPHIASLSKNCFKEMGL